MLNKRAYYASGSAQWKLCRNCACFSELRSLHLNYASWFLSQIRAEPIGVRAGGARGAAAPPKFGQLRFFGQREEIWAKPVFKGSLHVHLIILKS